MNNNSFFSNNNIKRTSFNITSDICIKIQLLMHFIDAQHVRRQVQVYVNIGGRDYKLPY